jgi:hypothetical protein
MRRLQNFILPGLLLLGSSSLLSACTSEAFKRASYDALHQRQCIEQTGEPNCDPNYPSYDEYQRQRAEIPKK